MNLDAYLSRPGAESMSALAKALDIHVDQVRQWRHGQDGRRPSPAKCADIERVTSGVVPCDELRPDLTWERIVDKDWPHPAGRPVLDVSRVVA